jgi:glycosyltransferase involved in cell wall biosynthesis
VLPALRREGLSKSVIEAMANAVTPIVTDTGGNAELVIDGVSGLVVPPGDAAALARAIERLYRAPAERIAMGRAARERIATAFRLETTVAEMLAAYRRVLGHPEASADAGRDPSAAVRGSRSGDGNQTGV